MKKVASKLDWKRMLGFEQITELRQSTTPAFIEAKVGHKVGQKVGTKIGLKIGAKQGIKA